LSFPTRPTTTITTYIRACRLSFPTRPTTTLTTYIRVCRLSFPSRPTTTITIYIRVSRLSFPTRPTTTITTLHPDNDNDNDNEVSVREIGLTRRKKIDHWVTSKEVSIKVSYVSNSQRNLVINCLLTNVTFMWLWYQPIFKQYFVTYPPLNIDTGWHHTCMDLSNPIQSVLIPFP
jgi:hypothetical protein